MRKTRVRLACVSSCPVKTQQHGFEVAFLEAGRFFLSFSRVNR